ncbi:MAG: glycosyltransferase family 2 protein [Candidatus Rokubacteria bacterium]|nr:glycosyltransferase family 2 protein [Candidatus Rokubacteria bacterium]
MSPEVSAAVVSFNTRDVTLRCLEATEAAAAGPDAALTLVDNGSSDGTVEAVRREFPAWRVIVLPENPGYGAALNRAFRTTPARLYLALNSDILLQPEALRILRGFLDAHPTCGLVGPGLAYPDGRFQPSRKRFPGLGFAVGEVLGVHALLPRNRWVRRFYYADADPEGTLRVDAVSGAAMLIREEAFRRVQGFDEGFRMYFEETDLCRRLRAAGFDVALCPAATAIHWYGASTVKTSVRQVEYYVSYIRFFRKHHGRWPARTLATAVALATGARMLGLCLRYPPLSGEQARVLGAKLGACARLLLALRRSTADPRVAEARP